MVFFIAPRVLSFSHLRGRRSSQLWLASPEEAADGIGI